MTFPKGSHPGAQWRKCDFQIHTPRDKDWGGLRSPSDLTDLDGARKEWAEHFVKECVARGLGAISVTDHHDTLFVPLIQDAIECLGLQDQLWFFPGVEVTCNDASQCLLLFDPKTQRAVLQRLFGGHLNSVVEPADHLVKIGPVTPCGRNIVEFIDEVHTDAVLRDIVIALPHGGDCSDHRSVIKPQFQNRFKDLEADGVYIERKFTELSAGTVTILQGKDAQWGNRRRGVLATGDNRDSSFSKLGANDCWIRLGEASTESIRQALLADEARITFSRPVSPVQRVLSMSVGSSMTGAHFLITFNEGSNAFIGGRGSGKTSVLEYLRFALGRSSLDVTLPDREANAREREMLRSTLANGGVRVSILRDGIEETWERKFASLSTITVATGGERPAIEVLNVEQAQTRFFARAFSQKQLSSLISDPKDADEQITGVAAAEVRVERQASLNEIERRRQEVRLAFESLVLHWQQDQALQEAKRGLSDVDRRYASMSSELEKAGLSQDAKSAIAEDGSYRIANRVLASMQSLVNSISESTEALDTAVDATQILLLQGAAFPELESADLILTELKQKIKEHIDAIRDLISGGRASIGEQQKKFDGRRASHDKVLSDALVRQNSLDEQLKVLTGLATEKERFSKEIETLTGEFSSRQGAQQNLDQKRSELRAEAANHRAILETAAARVENMSGGMLRASVERESIPAEYLAAFSDTCDNVRIQNYDSRCKDMLQAILKADGLGWDETVKIFFDIFHAKVITGAKQPTEAEVAQLRLIFGGLTSAQYQGIYSRIDSARVAKLVGAVAADFIAFSYSDRGSFIGFAQASPGQQAGALLTLLLNQEAGTLIIDQPEDDLDNRIIMDIVTQMRNAKTKRQLIFSTHNANVVVNGDADKIVVLKPATPTAATGRSKIAIDVDGAIESKKVKNAITATLEGGERAFELRRRKYLA